MNTKSKPPKEPHKPHKPLPKVQPNLYRQRNTWHTLWPQGTPQYCGGYRVKSKKTL